MVCFVKDGIRLLAVISGRIYRQHMVELSYLLLKMLRLPTVLFIKMKLQEQIMVEELWPYKEMLLFIIVLL